MSGLRIPKEVAKLIAGGAPVSSQVARVLTTLEALCGFAERGASNKDICAATGHSPVQVSRDLAELVSFGWVRKCAETERFFLLPRFGQLVFKVSADFERAAVRLEDRRRSLTGE